MLRFFTAFMLMSILGLPFSSAQLYFPPLNTNNWESTTPQALGWNMAQINSLYTWLEGKNTRAFIVLKDGKIVLERYFGSFGRDSVWMWASAGKGITAFLTGISVQEKKLDLSDQSSKYLGKAWTSLSPAKEDLITIWHQVTMTSGMNDLGTGFTCITPNCLRYVADAGTRWAYHNGPYSLMEDVLVKANLASSYNAYTQEKLKSKTGMDGTWVSVGPNNIFYSRARSMARFGLLMLNRGTWNNTPILTDTAYFRRMITPSQSINASYGYLWWLNGQKSYMRPQMQTVFPGMLCPNAPKDMYAAMGANGQLINVVPSMGLVVVRMGESPDRDAVPTDFQNEMWAELKKVLQVSTAAHRAPHADSFSLSPNPFSRVIHIAPAEKLEQYWLLDAQGRVVRHGRNPQIEATDLVPGVYFIRIQDEQGRVQVRKIVKR
jgi:CubicO group peptidase (beta-lactamase class C family)